MEKNESAPQQLVNKFEQYREWATKSPAEYLLEIKEKYNYSQLEGLEKELDKHNGVATQIQMMCNNQIRSGIYVIETQTAKQKLVGIIDNMKQTVFEDMLTQMVQNNLRIIDTFKQIQEKLSLVSHSTEEVVG